MSARTAMSVKARVIGVDRDALDAQVAEKARLLAIEKEREALADELRVQQDRHVQYLAMEAERVRAADRIALDQYRSTYQRRATRKEFDLSDPLGKRKDTPARVDDEDERCGPASLQKFAGEDLSVTERRLAQAAQLRDWIQQQADERDAVRYAERSAEAAFDDADAAVRAKAADVERAVADHRSAIARATAEFNRSLAAARRDAAAAERERTARFDAAEIAATLASPVMTGVNPAEELAASGTAPPGRYPGAKAEFRGLTAAARAAVLAEQDAQRGDAHSRRLELAEAAAAAAAEAERTRRAGQMVERQRARERAHSAAALAEAQRAQAAEAALRRSRSREDRFGAVSPQWLAHWGTHLP